MCGSIRCFGLWWAKLQAHSAQVWGLFEILFTIIGVVVSFR